jgi:hypothetical protein
VKKTAERRGNCRGLAISRMPSLHSEWVSAFLAFPGFSDFAGFVSLAGFFRFCWSFVEISVFFWCPVGVKVREPREDRDPVTSDP